MSGWRQENFRGRKRNILLHATKWESLHWSPFCVYTDTFVEWESTHALLSIKIPLKDRKKSKKKKKETICYITGNQEIQQAAGRKRKNIFILSIALDQFIKMELYCKNSHGKCINLYFSKIIFILYNFKFVLSKLKNTLKCSLL